MSELPDYITIQSACAVIGGDEKPISEPTFYRRFRDLVEHPTPGVARVRRAKLLARLNHVHETA